MITTTNRNDAKLRAWWWQRQGLDGSLRGKSAASVLERTGWARSVGGVGPYVTLFSRARTSRETADAAVAKLDICELPTARGCTYVIPAGDFALGLTVGRPFGDADMKTAAKLGVTAKEVDKLCDAVLGALGKEPLDPEAIRGATGKATRNLGEEGKKRGMITTLPLALGRLQASGDIRRVPVGGRLDQQRYKYVRWTPNPLAKSKLSESEALTELARHFFRWVGPATMKELQWFAGIGVKAAKDAVAPLQLEPTEDGSDRLLLAEDAKTFHAFTPTTEPQFALVSSLDPISATRRDVSTLIDDKHRATVEKITFGERPGSNLMDLIAHAILDRGRLIGFWEFDSEAGEIVWTVFDAALKKSRTLRAAVAETEAFVRDQLGDARSFSLDSPKSRKPKLEAMRRMA
ncbi:MAG: crosslink repair DNA glycosylase YcaQ family protein [bacterium]